MRKAYPILQMDLFTKLEDFVDDDNKVFALANPNESEAFGITLEPAGGSESPNLEQLYALGVATS